METTEWANESTVTDLARESLYRFLAAALSDPHGEGWRLVLDPGHQRLAAAAADFLRGEAGATSVPLGFGEASAEHLDLRPFLAEVCGAGEGLREEYNRVFGLVPARECPPYETEYHPSAEASFRSQQLADVAGFYRAFGIEPARATPERPDYLPLELEFMAFLLMKRRLAQTTGDPDAPEHARVSEDAERSFFQDHLAWWVPAFAAGLGRKAGKGPYAALSRVLAAFLPTERGRLNISAPRMPVQAVLIERPEEQPGCAGCSAAG